MRIVWFTGTAALLLLAGLAGYLQPLEPGALALQLTFTPHAFGAIVHAWSPAGLERYRSHLPWDFALLASYGTFGVLLVRRSRLFALHPPRRRGLLQTALPLAAAFDAAENLLHLWLTEVPRFGIPWAYAVAGACATLKWLLVLGFALAVLHALAASPGQGTAA